MKIVFVELERLQVLNIKVDRIEGKCRMLDSRRKN